MYRSPTFSHLKTSGSGLNTLNDGPGHGSHGHAMGISWAHTTENTRCFLERMTRFELATLTLAKKKRDRSRPYSPSRALQHPAVRKTVRPVRLSRLVRIPLYHHTRASWADQPVVLIGRASTLTTWEF